MALLSAYVYDPTGVNPLNLVVNERHNVQPPAEITDASLFFLRAAPAFAESIIVRDGPSATANVLVEGKDYILSTQFLWKSFELNKIIYGSITMINRNYSGDVYVQYQTLGGDFIVNDQTYLESLSREIYKTRYIYWEQVVQSIPGLPPFDHTMSGTDTVGWGEVVDAILRLAAAIIDTGGSSGGGGSGGGGDAALQQHIASTTAHRLANVGGSNLFNFALANDADFDNAAVNRYTNPAVIVIWIRKYITSLGLGTAPQDIQQLQQRVNQIDQTIQTIQTGQFNLQTALDTLSDEMDDLKARQDSSDLSVVAVAGEIPGIKDDINDLREKIDGDPTTGLEARMTAVESTAVGNTNSLVDVNEKLVDMQAEIDDIKNSGNNDPFDPSDILDRLTILEDQVATLDTSVAILKAHDEIAQLGYDKASPKQVITRNHQITVLPNHHVNIRMVAGGGVNGDSGLTEFFTNTSFVAVNLVSSTGPAHQLFHVLTGWDGVLTDGDFLVSNKQLVTNVSISDVVSTEAVAATDENGAAGLLLSDGRTYGTGLTVATGIGGSSSPHYTWRYTNDTTVNVTLEFTVRQYLPFYTLTEQPGPAAIEFEVVAPAII